MIQLTIQGVVAVLQEDDAVRFIRGNAVMDADDSYSLPLELLDHPENLRAISYLNNLKTKGDRGQTFAASLAVNGTLLLDGYVVINKLEDKYVKLTLKSNSLSFWLEAADTDLVDLDWPTIAAFNYSLSRLDADVFAELDSCVFTEKDYCCFPFINVQSLYNADDLEDGFPAGMFNAWDDENETFENSDTYSYTEESKYTDIDVTYTVKRSRNTVLFRVHSILTQLFELMGYTVASNFMAADDFKEIVLFNTINIWDLRTSTVNYGVFLPDVSVLNFLDNFRESGFVFDIDNCNKSVKISSASAKMNDTSLTPVTNIIADTHKITGETLEYYKVAMSTVGLNDSGNFSSSDPGNLDDIRIILATRDLLPDGRPIDSIRFVKSEGTYYQVNADRAWERITGQFQDIKNYDEDDTTEPDYSLSSPISAALSMTKIFVNSELYSRQLAMSVISVDPDSFTAIILTVYRGLQYARTVSSDPETYRYPHASYMAYDSSGDALSGISLNNTFFYGLVSAKVDFKMNCYPLEYQFLGNIGDLLLSEFTPLLIEGQKAILETRSAKVKGNNQEITITDTVYVEQITD